MVASNTCAIAASACAIASTAYMIAAAACAIAASAYAIAATTAADAMVPSDAVAADAAIATPIATASQSNRKRKRRIGIPVVRIIVRIIAIIDISRRRHIYGRGGNVNGLTLHVRHRRLHVGRRGLGTIS